LKNLNKRNASVLSPVKQSFEWGYVRWLHEPEDLEKGKLVVGHVTFFPHKKQENHLHTGDEQILYTISGKGEHNIDGHSYPLLPGTVYHIPPYAKHSVRNLGDELLEMIIVYNINSLNYSKILPQIDFTENYDVNNLKDIIDIQVLQDIQDKFSKAVDLAIVIKNREGEILTEPSNIPVFCRLQWQKGKHCLLDENHTPPQRNSTIIPCCYNLVSVSAPIYFSNRYIGSIFCGPVILNEPSPKTLRQMKTDGHRDDDQIIKEYLNITRVTKGRLYAVIETLKTINNFIVEMGINNLVHRELHNKTVQILKEVQERNKLERTLSETKMKLIQAQISPHFLFNTLSTIGQMAYMKGAKEAAETTFALANLLRTSLRKSPEMIAVRDELKFIEDYILIQKKRFKNIVETHIDVSDRLKDYKIPFLTLQTLVENAIIRGFEPSEKPGILRITGILKGKYMFFEVADNGQGIPEKVLKRILKGNRGSSLRNAGLGLYNLRQRLIHYYGSDFDFKIESEYGKGTRVGLMIPTTHERDDFGD